jgi:sulfur carrier protein
MKANEESIMNIYVNDEPTQTESDLSLAAFLTNMELDLTKSLAVAVNDYVISKTDWSTHQLQADDRLLLIAPVSGG